ncbi:ABC transporter permease [Diplocloster agilis]|uniref:ABC transporter permease n=1 Tax=Diplocloster agilis TaxID=2850323 RepID=UPI0008215EA8|nr:ABC transporter permease subunit [Suonthocola fibrivorans]MCU6734249.1 ABC transporter permease subunit [Suonthocola fibrivorans]SCJ31308.1 Inner membrane ABC transporter permease protein ycjO [uncultured Clostridium sp.]
MRALKNRESLKRAIYKHRIMYLFLLPALVTVIIFSYIPMVGVLMSFQDYDIVKGLFGSDWAGLKHFKEFLSDSGFWSALKNTLAINGLSILVGFPLPIMLAIAIFAMKDGVFKRVTQTISYLPHFVSWVVVGGLVYKLLDVNTGAINNLIKSLGQSPIAFLQDPKWFWVIIIVTCIWKELGWNTIIYLAALSGIDAEQYEAALVDGANGRQRLWHITIPGIMPVVGLMLIMTVGNLINANGSASFDAVYNLRNALTAPMSDTLDYYIFSQGIQHTEYSYAAAIGLVQGLVSLFLVISANRISRKAQGYGAF